MMTQDLRHSSGGVVCAGSILTAKAGAELLRAGGNAVDAAVGANLAAFCAEPVLTSPFGGGLAMVAGCEVPPVSLNFFARVPGLARVAKEDTKEFQGVNVRFGPANQTFHIGKGSVAIPLLLPGLLALHQRYGKMPLSQVVAPALELAKNGVTVTAELAGIFGILDPILRHTPETEALFAPKGHLLVAGDTFRANDLTHVLEAFAKADLVSILDTFQKNFSPPHGLVTEEDLRKLTPTEGTPVKVNLGEFDVYLAPPPVSGGLLVGFGLQLLESVEKTLWSDPVSRVRMMLAAMATTQAARTRVLDPLLHRPAESAQNELRAFLSPSSMKPWQEYFRDSLNGDRPILHQPSNELGSTTHISVLDNKGLACSITSSNGEGCGHLVPNTHAMANNFMGEEDLHPNGFHQMPAGTTLTSMMCPSIVTDAKGPLLALGTGGSNRIRTALLQVLGNHLFAGQTLEAAVTAPRIHYEGQLLYVEKTGTDGVPAHAGALACLDALPVEKLLFDTPNMFFGGVNAAARGNKGAGDARRGGQMVVVAKEEC